MIQGGTILDCACGDGAGAIEYLRTGPQNIVGFDLDREAVEAARRSVTDPNALFEVADATELPVETASVDLYISLETVEHVPDADALLSEAVRVLRPTGRLICSTPNRNVQNPGTSPNDPPICEFHVREYTPRELLDLLSPHFESVEFYGQNEVGRLRMCYLGLVGHVPSHRLAARLSQVAKLTRLLVDSPKRHAVVPVRPGHSYDLTIAVCSGPRPEARTRA